MRALCACCARNSGGGSGSARLPPAPAAVHPLLKRACLQPHTNKTNNNTNSANTRLSLDDVELPDNHPFAVKKPVRCVCFVVRVHARVMPVRVLCVRVPAHTNAPSPRNPPSNKTKQTNKTTKR